MLIQIVGKRQPKKRLSCARIQKNLEKGNRAIPEDLHADANEQKRREAKNDVHARLAENGRKAVGETVAEINREGDNGRADERGQNRDEVISDVMRSVCAERDGDRDGTGADGERQSQRIESAAENVGGIHVLLNLSTFVGVLLFKKCPTIGDDNKAAANLHNGDGNAEESQYVRADEIRSNDKNKAVERDAPGEKMAGGGAVVAGESEKYGRAADRIHDGEESADNEKNTFCDFKQGLAPRE